MITYKTLNSTYEVEGLRVRRVGGDNAPTPRFEDEGWRDALWIGRANGSLVFFWGEDPTGVKRNSTITSEIISITPPQEEAMRPVDKGVALLDQRHPDWWKNVELADFDLHDPENCVLGHAFPECHYNEVVQELSGLRVPDPAYLNNLFGMNTEWHKFIEDVNAWEQEYGFTGDDGTERAWKDLIRFRQMHPDQGGVMW